MNLHDAIGAVRAESLERTNRSGATRARVLESLERSPRRRLHAAVAAVIASLFGASAFAWYAQRPTAPPAKAPVIALESTAVETAAREPSTPREVTVVRIEAPPPVEASTSLGQAAEVSHVPSPPAARAEVSHVPSPPAARVEVSPAAEVSHAAQPPAVERDAELTLYAAAHRLHFVERDLARAVAAWDRYLAATPDGRLAPEARFNRLVALVKLERWDEAARAIETVDASSRPADVEKLRALIKAHAH